MVQVNVVLKREWAKLPSEVLACGAMTAKRGGPASRMNTTLFAAGRVFTGHNAYLVRHPLEVSDVDVDSVIADLAAATPRLARTALWHRMLVEAYKRHYRDEGGSRFLSDSLQALLVPAWNAAARVTDPGRAEANLEIANLSRGVREFSSVRFRQILADPATRAELDTRLDLLWTNSPPVEDDGELDFGLNERILAYLRLVGTVHTSRDAERVPTQTVVDAEKAWSELAVDSGIDKHRSAAQLGLSLHDSQRRPLLIGAGDTEEDGLYSQPFRALDRSVYERLNRVALSSTGELPEHLAGFEVLVAAVGHTVLPHGLPTVQTRAALLAGNLAMSGVTVKVEREPRSAPAATPSALARHTVGSIDYFGRRWKKLRAVAREQSIHATNYRAVHNFIESPLDYFMGRLWTRLYRASFAEEELTSDSVWQHIHGAFVSVSTTISTVVSHSARERISELSVDDDTTEAARFRKERLLANVGLTDRRADDVIARVERLAGSASSRVLRRASREHGYSQVEEFIAEVATYATIDADRRLESERLWARWSRELAEEQADHDWLRVPAKQRARGIEPLEFALGQLPSFDQFIVQSARRARAVAEARHLRGIERRVGALAAEFAREKDSVLEIPLHDAGDVLDLALSSEDSGALSRVTAVVTAVRSGVDSAELRKQWTAWCGELAVLYGSHQRLDGDVSYHAARLPSFEEFASWLSRDTMEGQEG